jgi:hypothetical protein
METLDYIVIRLIQIAKSSNEDETPIAQNKKPVSK